MKKIISIVLMLALCLGLFAGCNNQPADPTEPAVSDLANAKTYLFKMYNTAGKDEENKILADKDLTAVVVIGGVTYPVTWTVEITAGPADSVKIGTSETKNHVKLDVMDQPEEELHFTLTGTVKDEAGNTESMSLKCFTPAVKKVEISDDKIVIFNADSGMYVSGTDYLYTSSSGSQKHELELTEDKGAALQFTVRKNDDGTVTFKTNDGKFLMADGTNVQIVDTEGEHTAFVLEPTENGQFIKCAKATYNDNPQYLEIYSGYLTVYGMNESKAPIYTFQFETVANQSAIIDAAYSLGAGESLVGGPYTLTGVISSIDTEWSDQYNNITVTIVCDGDAERPIMCYRLKGEGAKTLAVGDTITVTGEIKNYNGTIEFDAGCNLDKVVSANGGEENPTEPEVTEPATEPKPTEPKPTEPATKPSGTLADAIAEAGKLANKEYLSYEVTITGTITDDPKASDYTAGQFRFTVSDGTNSLLCYFVPVTGGTPKKGDTVTVTGKLTAYNGTAQFDSKASATLAGGNSDNDGNTGSNETIATDVTLTNGMKVVIYAPAFGKAFSSTVTGYYQNGVDVTVADGKLTGYTDAEVWTVTVNSDGTYSFSMGGQNISMGAEFNSMKLGDVNDDWEVISLGNGLYNIKNAARGTFIDWYAQKSNWSTYASENADKDTAYQLAFFVVE